MLYVPSMENNPISFGQLLDKNYIMRLDDKEMKVFNANSKLVLKAHLLNIRTFKIMINMVDHECLALTTIGNQN